MARISGENIVRILACDTLAFRHMMQSLLACDVLAFGHAMHSHLARDMLAFRHAMQSHLACDVLAFWHAIRSHFGTRYARILACDVLAFWHTSMQAEACIIQVVILNSGERPNPVRLVVSALSRPLLGSLDN